MQSAGLSAELIFGPFRKAMSLARMWRSRMELATVGAGRQSDSCQCIPHINPAPSLPQYDPQSLVNHVVLLLGSVECQAVTVKRKNFQGGPHFSVDTSAGLAGKRWARNCWGGREPSLRMQRIQSVANSGVESMKHKRGATGAMTAASVMQQLPQAISCP